MKQPGARRQSMTRVFLIYAVVGLVLVVVLGLLLASSYRHEAQRRGVAEGRSEAMLIAETAVEPILDGRPLSRGPDRRRDNRSCTASCDRRRAPRGAPAATPRPAGQRRVLRRRHRASPRPEDEAIEAAHGQVVARLTHLNSDPDDTGPIGPEAVEVYVPLVAGTPAHRVGVLEVYLPYAPIDADVSAGLARPLPRPGPRARRPVPALFADLVLGDPPAATPAARQHLPRRARRAHGPAQPHRVPKARRGGDRRGRAPRTCPSRRDRRPRPVQGDQRHPRAPQRRRPPRRDRHAARRPAPARRHPRAARRRRVRPRPARLRRTPRRPCGAYARRSSRRSSVSGLPLSVDASHRVRDGAARTATDVDELLQRAEVAMYAAKSRHAGVLRYDRAQDLYDAANLALASELRHAIDADELVAALPAEGAPRGPARRRRRGARALAAPDARAAPTRIASSRSPSSPTSSTV